MDFPELSNYMPEFSMEVCQGKSQWWCGTEQESMPMTFLPQEGFSVVTATRTTSEMLRHKTWCEHRHIWSLGLCSGTKRDVKRDTYKTWVGWVRHTPDWLTHPPPPKYSSIVTLMVASSTFVVSQLFLPPNCRDAKEFTDCLSFLTNWGNSML